MCNAVRACPATMPATPAPPSSPQRKFRRRDIMEAVGEGSARGLLVTLLNLFNTDGDPTLSRTEFTRAALALGYDTSDESWAQLCKRFAKKEEATVEKERDPYAALFDSDEAQLDLSLLGEHFRNKYDDLLEACLRQCLRGIVTLSTRLSIVESDVDGIKGADARDRQRKIQDVMRRVTNGLLSKCYDGWKKITKGQADLKNRVARRWRNQTIAGVWLRWQEMVEELKHGRQVLARVAGRLRSQQAAMAFAAWLDLVSEARQRWDVAERAVHRMMNQHVSHAFEAWKEALQRAKEQRVAVGQVLGRLKHRLASMAFFAWSERVSDLKWQREAVAKVIGRMQNRAASDAFEAWREAVEHSVSTRSENLRHAGNLLVNRASALAFRSWREAVEEIKEHREQQMTQARQMAGRMLNSLSGRCFDAWCRQIEEQKRIFKRAAHAIGPGRLLWLSFSTWGEAVREAIAQRDREEERSKVLGAIDERMVDLITSRLDQVLVQKIEAQMDSKMVTMQQTMQETFLTEHLAASREAMVAMEEKLRELPLQMEERMAEAARTATEELQEEMKRREEEEDMPALTAKQQKKKEQQRATASRAIAKMKNRLVGHAFEAWYQAVAEAKWKRETLSKVLGRMAHRIAAKAFLAWTERVDEIRQQKESATKILARMRFRAVALVFEHWKDSISQAKADLHRAVGSWTNLAVGRAWRAWAEMVDDRNRQLQIVKQVLGRMRNKLLSTTFCAWAQEVAQRVKTRELKKLAEEQFTAKQREEEERTMKEAQQATKHESFLTQLREVGGAWFDEMMHSSELMTCGPKKIIRSINEKAGVSEEDESDFLRTSMGSIVYPVDRNSLTVLDLLDRRYMAPGGQLHGRHVEAQFRQLEQAMSDKFDVFNEQFAFLRSMLGHAIKASGGEVPDVVDSSKASDPKPALRPIEKSPRFTLTRSLHETASADGVALERKDGGVASRRVSRPGSAARLDGNEQSLAAARLGSAQPSLVGSLRPSRPGSAHMAKALRASRSAATVLGYNDDRGYNDDLLGALPAGSWAIHDF